MVLSATRKKWQSNIQHTKSQLCLDFSKVLSTLILRRKQEKGGENPNCSEIMVPDNLVEEILHLLPVKSLGRFKSVSKGWKSLIESEHLIDKHLSLQQKKNEVKEKNITINRSLLKKCHTKDYSKSGPYKSVSSLRAAGSCNGLVCIYDAVYVYLINPTMRIIRRLEPPQVPQRFTHSVVFGRDVVKGTYKVVVVYGYAECIIFELGTNKWRRRHESPVPISFTEIDTKRNPVFVNGSLYWSLRPNHSKILVMDLHTEKFRTLSQPKDISTDSKSGIYMWSLEGRLYVSFLRHGLASYVWVLVKDEVSERWVRTGFPSVDVDGHILSVAYNSARVSPSLVSPYQSSSHF